MRGGGWQVSRSEKEEYKCTTAVSPTIPVSYLSSPLLSPLPVPPPCPPSLSPDNDTLVFIDFRADRMRQIVEAMGIKPQFDTDTIPKDLVSPVASSHFEF